MWGRMIYMYLVLLTFLVMKFSSVQLADELLAPRAYGIRGQGWTSYHEKSLCHAVLCFATSFLTRSSDSVSLSGTFWPGGMRAPLFINGGWTSLSRQRLSSQPHHGSQELNSQVPAFWVTFGNNKHGYVHASPRTTSCLIIIRRSSPFVPHLWKCFPRRNQKKAPKSDASVNLAITLIKTCFAQLAF